jgi:O-antigen/teichoic acid export membrane protein
MSQLKKGAILSYINILLVNTVGLVLTPFIIRCLGKSEYGLYALIGSLVAYLTLMDFGLNNTIVRFVSKYQAEKDSEGEKNFLGTIMSVYFFISFVLILLGTVFYFNIEVFFENSLLPSQIEDAKTMFLILLFDIAIALPSGSFLAICTAYGQFVFPKTVTIIRYILRSATVVFVLTLGGKSISIVVIDTVFNILVVSVTFYYCLKVLKVKFSFKERSKVVIKEIFSYSIWIFILAMIMTFQWNAGQIILGFYFKTEVIAVFAVGLMLGGYFGAFSGVINTLLLPKAAKMLNEKSSSVELTDTMIRVGRINSFISLLILSGFILIGKEFVVLWVGDSYIESWNIALLIMFSSIIPLTQSFGNSIVEIRNKVKYRSIGMLVSTTIAIFCSFILGKHYGIYGVIIPIVTAGFVNSIINNVLYIYVFDFKIVKFYKSTFLKQIVYSAVILMLFITLKKCFFINTWFKLVLSGAVYSAFYLIFYYILLFNKEEKSLVWRK